MDSNKITCQRIADYFNCRLMPHGGIVLFPAVICTLALCASFADDGCDYARVSGPAVEMLTGSSSVPFVDCGMSAYRIPGYYPAENSWRVVYTDNCRPYEYMDLLTDTSWLASEWLRFFALVVGGTTAMFIWTSACLTLRPNYWQAAGIGAAVTCVSTMCSFVWFYTKLCHANATNINDFEAGRVDEGEGSTAQTECTLFFGSKCAIASTVLWAVASALILLRPYPYPVPKYIAHDDDDVVPSVSKLSSDNSSSRFTLTAANRRQNMGKDEKKNSFRTVETMSESQGSLRNISDSLRAGPGNEYRQERKALAGSQMSGITYA